MLASRKGMIIVKIIQTSIHLTYEVAKIDCEIPMKLKSIVIFLSKYTQ